MRVCQKSRHRFYPALTLGHELHKCGHCKPSKNDGMGAIKATGLPVLCCSVCAAPALANGRKLKGWRSEEGSVFASRRTNENVQLGFSRYLAMLGWVNISGIYLGVCSKFERTHTVDRLPGMRCTLRNFVVMEYLGTVSRHSNAYDGRHDA